MFAEIDYTNWIERFRQVLDYYVPPLDSTPAVNVGGLLAVVVGLVLVFRGGKFERIVVTAFGLLVGGWLGYRIASYLNLPEPFTVAVAGLALAGLAFKTYRMWLAAGSVFVLFGIAIAFQLGRGDLQRYLPTSEQFTNPIQNSRISLPSPEQQLRNSRNDWRDQVRLIGERIGDELKRFGLAGWVLPLAAAVIGAALAYWALRAFAIVWLGFIGAHLAVIGGATILSANWHEVRNAMFANPQAPAAIAVALWLLGLVIQAKDARFPKKPSAPAEKEPAKS
ncbi:MAG TPA: hypothetical protein VNT79_12115 [Phycisphaerae bacterium]|nr:hypothetical protein [Phycisphaerae bacterium]